jgi:hypothetical protein
MASIGGRVSSARLIKSVRERRINHVNIKKDKTIPLKNVDKNKIKVEKMVLEPVDEEQLNIEELNSDEIKKECEKIEDEPTFFHILTPDKVLEKKIVINERKKKIEERNEKAESRVSGEGKLVDGKIVYENNIDSKDELSEFGETDPSLEDGNPLPQRYGIIKNELLQKPLIELGKK